MAGPFDPSSPEFPPRPPREGVSYSSYLQIDGLLNLQQPLSNPEHHDELLFIIVHQVYELWFRQLVHELKAARTCFDHDEVLQAHKIFKRLTTIQQVLVEQLKVLETMTPQDFNHFRGLLNPASGFQSAQFRVLEALSGIKDKRFLKLHQKSPELLSTLQSALDDPSVYDAFIGMLARKGFDVPTAAPEIDTPDSERVIQAFKEIYEESEKHYALYLMCEYLIEYDELFQTWRFCHVKMVERTIGERMGTGGSPGARYLWTTLTKRFFPELWRVRTHLGGGAYGG